MVFPFEILELLSAETTVKPDTSLRGNDSV